MQLQLRGDAITAGICGVIATNPMSLIGEFAPEKTTLTAAATEPVEPLYACGRAGPPLSAPGTVIGPSVSGSAAAM